MEMEKKSNKAIWITAGVIALLVLAFITNGFGLITGNVVSVSQYDLSIGNSPVIGNSDAPVTIYEFSDFSCPACVYADEKIIPSLMKDYVETGKVKIVYKYFPGHGQGISAHEVALALNEQNLFWEFADLAYKNSEKTNSRTAMIELAKTIGADVEKIQTYLDSNSAMTQLNADIEMAKSNSIYATPTFIVGNQMIKGAQDYSIFKKAIDSQL